MKKIISIISALAMMASLSFNAYAAAEPRVYLEVSSTGLNAGDVVTVTCKYDGFDVTPYDDNEGAGQKITGAQIRIDIPGGIGTAAEGEQFLRPGVTNASGFATGAPQWNWDKNNNQFTAVIGNIDDPMNDSGTIFTISMKLNQAVTSDLVFDFTTGYEQTVVYDNYTDWEMGDTVQVKNATTASATLAGPEVEEPEEPVFSATTTPLDSYYVGDTTGDEIKRIGCTLENVTATKLNLEFKSEGKEDKNIQVDIPKIGGSPVSAFEAWILNAVNDVTLTVTEVAAQ